MNAAGKGVRGVFKFAAKHLRSGPEDVLPKEEALAEHGDEVADAVTPPATEVVPEPDPAPEPKRYGPYHRRASPTQTLEDAEKIAESGELWGRPPGNYFVGGHPYVKAFKGPLLPEARPGSSEFYTFESHDVGHSPQWGAHWYPGGKGVWVDGEFAKIKVVVTKIVR